MSDEFTFFPDSMNARAQNQVVEENPTEVEFPPVSGHDLDVHWEPYNDFMKSTVVKEPIAMYDGSTLKGHIVIAPKGLTGGGLYLFEQAELESDLYKFKFSEFRADTADFKLKSLEESALAFSTNNVNAFIDFKERKGTFLSNGGGSFIDFPVNQYICFMDKFTWFMDDEAIELGADAVAEADQTAAADVKLEGSKFISVHPDQDSLSFYAPKAKYDLRKNTIAAKQIRFIPIVDALIYPDSGNAVIRKKAKIDPLENAKIVANSVTRYHTIYDARVILKARKNYTASGKYDYKDENKQISTIDFAEIKVDTTFQTVADGKITEEEGFSLSPAFEFMGDVFLRGNARFLIFEGVTGIRQPCDQVVNSRFKFKEEVNPLDIYLPVDTSLTDEQGKDLSIGLMMSKDSAHIYSTFFTPPKNKTDIPIVSSLGYVYFDKREQTYKVSSKEKIGEIALPGDYISLANKTCDVYGEGDIDFGANLGRIETTVVGKANHNLTEDSVSMDLMLLVDFFFIEKVLDEMAKSISEYEGLEPVDFDRDIYERGLQTIMGKEEGDKLISQVNLYGNFKKFPSELNKTLFINSLQMYWNPETQSYMSVGKIGLGNVYKKQVNKYVDGYVEVVRKRSGDEISFYFELDRDNWYFFSYKRNMLQAVSSVEKFNDAIKEIKPDKRKMEKEKGKDPYSFMLSTTRKRNDFVKRFVGDDD